MQYERLIREAWRMAWTHRFLWLLGILAGGGTSVAVSGSPGEWKGSQAEIAKELNLDPRDLDELTREVMAWLASHIEIIVLGVGLIFFVIMAITLLSLACQASMAAGTLRLARGEPASLGTAWSGGIRHFGSFFGLWLLLAGLTLVIGLCVAALIGGIIAGSANAGSAWVGVTLGIVLGAPFALFGLALSIVLSVVVPLAQRAIVDQDLGPIAALRVGWGLARQRIVTSLLLWLLAVVLGILVGIGAMIALGIVAVIFAIIGIPLALIFGASGPVFVALGIAGIIALVIILTMVGLAHAFFWSFWTLAYQQLRSQENGPAPGEPAPMPASA